MYVYICIYLSRVELNMTFGVHYVQGLGLAIGAAFMDVKKATTFASVILMTFMLSGGFFVQVIINNVLSAHV